MSTVRLAVCADDFGMDPRVNAGVLALADQGRLSAIACMVGAPSWHAGAPSLRTLDAAQVETGLHLDLTQFPLDARMRRSLPEWILRSHAAAVDRRGLRREIDAQLDAFCAGMQRPPAFIDGHEYVHQLPGIRDLLLQALAARGWRPWLRSTRRPQGLRSAKARLVQALGASALARRARAAGLPLNRRLLGIYRFDAEGTDYLQHLRQWLALARSGDLLVCHPAAGSPASLPPAPTRRSEFETLAGPAFGALLEEARIRIVPLPAALAAAPLSP